MTRPDDIVVVRHAEQVNVATERVPNGIVRFSTRIETAERTLTVQVRRQVLTVEQLAAPEMDAARATETAGPREIVLYEEVPVVTMASRAYERVHVAVNLVSDATEITTAVSSEQIEISDVDGRPLSGTAAP